MGFEKGEHPQRVGKREREKPHNARADPLAQQEGDDAGRPVAVCGCLPGDQADGQDQAEDGGGPARRSGEQDRERCLAGLAEGALKPVGDAERVRDLRDDVPGSVVESVTERDQDEKRTEQRELQAQQCERSAGGFDPLRKARSSDPPLLYMAQDR